MSLEEILYAKFLENEVWRWCVAPLVATLAFLLTKALLAFSAKRLRAFAETTGTTIDDLLADLLDRTKTGFLVVVSLYAGSRLVLTLAERYTDFADGVVRVAVIIQGAFWASAALGHIIRVWVKGATGDEAAAATSISIIGLIGRIVLWALVVVLVLQNVGFNVTGLIAGLGVGGIALALASQHILGDLFASIVILLDQPFVVGDFIIVGDFMGAIEHIGLKTTRIRSLSGEQVIFSNTDLLNSRVRNFKRMYERRVVFKVGVTYQTPREKIAAVPGMIRDVIESREHARFDRSHFQAFGDFALQFETVYYLSKPDYNVYMDTQQQINLEIHKRFEDAGIEFAYPTQTVFVTGVDSEIDSSVDPDGEAA